MEENHTNNNIKNMGSYCKYRNPIRSSVDKNPGSSEVDG